MKQKIFLIILATVLLLSGCARSAADPELDTVHDAGTGSETVSTQEKEPINEEVKEEPKQPLPQEEAQETKTDEKNETLNVQEVLLTIPNDYASMQSAKELDSFLNVKDYVIFKGKKVSAHPFIEEYTAFPIEIEILEPYYGNVQKEKTLIMWEKVGVWKKYDDLILPVISEDLETVEENTEYIFVLRKNVNEKTGEEYYTYVSRNHTFSKISDRDALAEKVKNGTATKLEQFRHDVLETYLNHPDTRIDLYHETSKLLKGIPEDAPQEEILDLLPAEQKTLFEALLDQYGSK